MEESRSLKKNATGSLASREVRLSIGALEKALLTVFPKEDACSWDYTGMYVGNPAEEVHGVAVALDPTVRAMKEAVNAGANVLVTHHPVFLDAPTCFTPFALQGQTSGAGVHYALTHGLSVMSFHTACDASVEGLGVLPALLRLNQVGDLDTIAIPIKGLALFVLRKKSFPYSIFLLVAFRCLVRFLVFGVILQQSLIQLLLVEDLREVCLNTV